MFYKKTALRGEYRKPRKTKNNVFPRVGCIKIPYTTVHTVHSDTKTPDISAFQKTRSVYTRQFEPYTTVHRERKDVMKITRCDMCGAEGDEGTMCQMQYKPPIMGMYRVQMMSSSGEHLIDLGGLHFDVCSTCARLMMQPMIRQTLYPSASESGEGV